MKKKLYKVTCDPTCGFEVQSHDEEEVLGMAKQHAKEKHDDDVSDAKARSMMQTM